MALEDIILVASLLLVAADVVIQSRRGGQKSSSYLLSVVGMALLVGYYALFVSAFLGDDFSVQQVYSYSSSMLPVALKVYASWGGSSGSLLLITLMIGLLYIAYRAKHRVLSEKHVLATARVLAVVLLFFMVMTAGKGPFARYDPAPIDGRGLNPQLQSVWMFYHPLVVFGGYAFTVLAFAVVVGYLETGVRQEKLLDVSMKSAWLLFTIGIALGGLWAYEVLGWGGYWAWDPVETASLLPWFALTAYFHGHPAKGGDLSREFLVVLGFDALLFLSALTRGGILQSVHAYAFSPAGPILIIGIVVATAYTLWVARRREAPVFKIEAHTGSTRGKLMLAGLASLLGMFLVCFAGVIVPTVVNLMTGGDLATSFDFYNYGNATLVMLFVASTLLCGLEERVFRVGLGVLGAAALAGAALVFLGYPTPNPIANFGIPLTLAALAIVVVGAGMSLAKSFSGRLASRHLVHLGTLIVVLGVFLNAPMVSTGTLTDVGVGTSVSVIGVSVEVGQPQMILGEGQVYFEHSGGYAPEYSTMIVPIVIAYQGRQYEVGLVGRFYPNYGVVAQPRVVGDGLTDIYVHLNVGDPEYEALFQALIGAEAPPETVSLSVSTQPMVNVIWAGAALMSLGILASLLLAVAGRRLPG